MNLQAKYTELQKASVTALRCISSLETELASLKSQLEKTQEEWASERSIATTNYERRKEAEAQLEKEREEKEAALLCVKQGELLSAYLSKKNPDAFEQGAIQVWDRRRKALSDFEAKS